MIRLLFQGLSVVFLFFSVAVIQAQNKTNYLKVGPQADGSILVPTNQLLRPAGAQIYMPGRPVDLVLLHGEQYLLLKNMKSLDLIRLSDKIVVQTLPYAKSGSSFTGICTSKDNRNIFVTDANDRILIANLNKSNNLNWDSFIQLPKPAVGGDPVPGGLILNTTEDKIFVTLSRNNSLAVVKMADKTVSEIPVGIAPYDIILKSDSKGYVSNWGGRRPAPGEPTYNSSGTLVLVNPETGVANDGSVSVIDLNRNMQIKEIRVGLHPSGMALSPDKSLLYVACANSDKIYVINTITDEVSAEISVHSNRDIPFGSSPNAVTVSPDGKFLYVANGSENAVCVIETSKSNRVAGYIPTGWYPGSVALNKNGTALFVANIKGSGSRNKGADKAGYNSHDHMGSVSVIDVPDKKGLKNYTSIVWQNNSLMNSRKKRTTAEKGEKRVPVPQLPGQASHFKHVVYIIKENRTYDQVFGDMTQGDGDTNLVHFGRRVTPNHHKLAETFVLMDNFYCSGVLSADGHQWTDESYVTDYLEKFFGGFTRSYPFDGNDALAYASSGFIWDNVLRKGLSFRNYGEFVDAKIVPEAATFTDIYQDFKNGTKKISIRAKANLEQIEPYLCPTYIGFPNTVPDVYRASEFIRELKEFSQNDNFPNFVIMLLPNDHTSGTKPGMPTPNAAVADNDLALGQIVEAISKSKFWKETCIFVTEDDPQAGLDHVDGHRTVGMVISPYTKRREVVSTYYSQINMVRTIENILGVPPMNQLDQAAEAMTDCFSDTPDFEPYTALINNIPLDELNPSLAVLSGKRLFWAEKSMEQDLEDYDRIDEDIFNRILWYAVKGYDRPYPELQLK